MKTNLTLLAKITLMMIALIGTLNLLAQEKKGLPLDTDFHFYIADVTRVNGSQIEFDLLLLNTNPAASFELGTIQAGILVNPEIFNKGDVKASFVSGTSTLNPTQVPGVISFIQKKGCIKIAPKTPPGIGNGSIISIDPEKPSRLCRVRLSNSKEFLNGNHDIRFCLNGKPYPTKLSRYVHATGQNTPLTVNSYTCFTQMEQENRGSSLGKKGNLSNEMIRVYPNPNDGIFELEINAETKLTYDLQIRNELGTLIFQDDNIEVNGKTNYPVKINNAPSGDYTVVLSRNGEMHTQKFIIRH